MKKLDDYVATLLCGAVLIITVLIAALHQEIKKVKEQVKELQNKVEVVSSYHYDHSQIK